jgi:uncharacterized membrane protein HdeD (DUF308 family)
MKDESVLKTVRNVTLIFAVLYTALGIVTLLFSKQVVSVLGYLLGAGLAAFGLYRLFLYFRRKRTAQLLAYDLFAGALLIAFGVICLVYHSKVTAYIAIIFGILLLAGSIIKFQNAIDLQRIGLSHWALVLLLGLVTLGMGVLLILKPAFIGRFYLLAAGIFLVYDGISDFAIVFLFAKRRHQIRKEEKQREEADPTPASPAKAEDPFTIADGEETSQEKPSAEQPSETAASGLNFDPETGQPLK